LLGDWDPQGVEDVADPYYGDLSGFEITYQHCLRSLKVFLEKELNVEADISTLK